MLKNLLPLFSVILFLTSCGGSINDLDRSGIKGNVKSIQEEQFEARHRDGQWAAGDQLRVGTRVVNYDEQGLYVNLVSLGLGGDTTAVAYCKRENGEMVEEIFEARYNQTTTRTLLDRVSPKQLNYELWQNDVLQYEGANYFDSKGRLIRQVQVINEEEVVMYHSFEKNLLVKSIQENLDGERLATRIYEYTEFDDQGNWTTQLLYLDEEKIKPDRVIKRTITYY